MSGFVAYIKDILDKDASPSFGRVSAAVVVFFILAWECYLVYSTSHRSALDLGWVALVATLWGGSGIKEAYIKGKELISGNSPSN